MKYIFGPNITVMTKIFFKKGEGSVLEIQPEFYYSEGKKLSVRILQMVNTSNTRHMVELSPNLNPGLAAAWAESAARWAVGRQVCKT